MESGTKEIIHDIKGALAIVKGFLEVLDRSGVPTNHREYHAAALKCVMRVRDLVDVMGAISTDRTKTSPSAWRN